MDKEIIYYIGLLTLWIAKNFFVPVAVFVVGSFLLKRLLAQNKTKK